MKSQRGAHSEREDAATTRNGIAVDAIVRKLVQKPGTIKSQAGRESIARPDLERGQAIISGSAARDLGARILVIAPDRPGAGVVVETPCRTPGGRGRVAQREPGRAARAVIAGGKSDVEGIVEHDTGTQAHGIEVSEDGAIACPIRARVRVRSAPAPDVRLPVVFVHVPD